PLETLGPIHNDVAGWPLEPDLPLALVLALGTEPRRADGLVETLEPDILSVFVPIGDEPDFNAEVHNENRRVLEVGGEPVKYDLRDPISAHGSLLATIERLSQRARVIIVPLGPKIFSALALNAAIAVGAEIGVWRA